MDKNKLTSAALLVAMIICYICAVIMFMRSKTGMGTAWFCIGIVFMIAGMSWKRRSQKK